VVSVPGISGESHVISFEMKARKKGKWESCAEMTSDLTPEIAVACDGGRIK
jgi:hypothetical protein